MTEDRVVLRPELCATFKVKSETVGKWIRLGKLAERVSATHPYKSITYRSVSALCRQSCRQYLAFSLASIDSGRATESRSE